MTPLRYSILPFEPVSATPAEWARYHAFRRIRHQEMTPDDPLESDAAFEAGLRISDPDQGTARRVVMLEDNPDTQVGAFLYVWTKPESPDFATGGQTAWARIAVLERFRRQGIGHRLLAEVLKLMHIHGQRIVGNYTDEADGKEFVRRIGAEIAQEGHQNRLSLDELDWAMVRRWVEEGEVRSPGARIEIFESAPDDIVEPYCAVFTEVGNQVPRGTLAIGDYTMTPEIRRRREAETVALGETWLTAVLLESDGEISGVTEVIYSPEGSPILSQDLTGVIDHYRGGGRGKWLKAAMLELVRERFPDITTVSTGNATSNAPMLAINHRLGFRPHKADIASQMTYEALEAYLRGRGLLPSRWTTHRSGTMLR